MQLSWSSSLVAMAIGFCLMASAYLQLNKSLGARFIAWNEKHHWFDWYLEWPPGSAGGQERLLTGEGVFNKGGGVLLLILGLALFVDGILGLLQFV